MQFNMPFEKEKLILSNTIRHKMTKLFFHLNIFHQKQTTLIIVHPNKERNFQRTKVVLKFKILYIIWHRTLYF